MIKNGAGITKFMNTQESAIATIDHALDNSFSAQGIAYLSRRKEIMQMKHGAFLYEDLTSRIDAARQRQLNLQSDLQVSLDDPTLQLLFQKEQKHNKFLLVKFEQQLKVLESPPEPTSDDSDDDETISSVSSHDSTPPSPTAHVEPTIDDELVPSTRDSAAPSEDPDVDVASPAVTMPVDSPTSNAPLDTDTASFTASTPPPPQPSVLHSDDDAFVPASPEVAILPQDPLPLTDLFQNDMNAPHAEVAQAEAATLPSTEPTQPPRALPAGTLDDAGRLPSQKPRGWMKALLIRIKGMFRRKRASRGEIIG
ncbi:hypothetical protein CVT24_002718 [Panaeolus cyanescens]|uniref:Uncharacterized protein n=1 Tax=Panaeolus cyanescens TaxID=181874 RepID=A0A409WQ08_9AGAR|nr:hypothetical protein CVT24_002718 [Panaeolus cyanescens]